MKRKQITAILLSAIMTVTACMPMNSISAFAAESSGAGNTETAAVVEMQEEEAPAEEAEPDTAVAAQEVQEEQSVEAEPAAEPEESGEKSSIIRDASEKLVSAYASGTTDEFDTDTVLTRKFKLKSDLTVENSELDCVIEEKLGKDGMLYFEVKNDAEQSPGGTYTLMVAFSSNVKESASDSREKTKKTTITWKLHSIRKA